MSSADTSSWISGEITDLSTSLNITRQPPDSTERFLNISAWDSLCPEFTNDTNITREDYLVLLSQIIPEYGNLRGIREFFPFVFLPLGLVTNFLACIILTRPAISRSSGAIYLFVLANSNSVYLLWEELPDLYVFFAEKEFTSTPARCKLHGYFTVAARALSSWLLTGLAVDRFVNVGLLSMAIRPVPKGFSIKMATFIVSLAVFVHSHLVVSLTNLGTTCVYSTGELFYANYFPLLDLVLTAFIPGVVMAFSSACIILKVMNQITTKQQKAGGGPLEQDSLPTITAISTAAMMMYLTLALPSRIYSLIAAPPAPRRVCDDYSAHLWHYITQTALALLFNLNMSIGFFVYLFSGYQFRMIFADIFLMLPEKQQGLKGQF